MRCSACESAIALGAAPQAACSDCALTERTAELVAALNRATWPWCLVHNVASIGALFASFRAGDNFGFHMGEDQSQCTCQWSPGRGELYRPATRCAHETDDDGNDGVWRTGCARAVEPSGECTCGMCEGSAA